MKTPFVSQRAHSVFGCSAASSFTIGALSLLVTCIFVTQGLAQTVLSDNFLSSNRDPGRKILKTMLETGNATWEGSYAAAQTVQGGDGISYSETTGFMQKVKVPEEAQTIIRVEARVRLTSDGSAVVIGIGDPPEFNATWLGGLMLALNGNGTYSLSFHPVPVGEAGQNLTRDFNKDPLRTLMSGPTGNFDRNGVNTLMLEYDRVSNTLKAEINGEKLFEKYDLTSREITPVFLYAGFSGWGQQADTTFLESFTLTVE